MISFFGSITQGTFVSMGVYSDGSYNVPSGLIYSFPVTCRNGEWSIVQGMNRFNNSNTRFYYATVYNNVNLFLLGLPIDEVSRKKMDLTAEELKEEKDLAYSCLS